MLGCEQAQRATRFCFSFSFPWLEIAANCQRSVGLGSRGCLVWLPVSGRQEAIL